ncbi:unnamed protein product [Ilex paraguariensis]|uniref:Uncharacterized protein n=1 Tax=Ilex paraguariensis TaxID=185542 RepID=A0ABC8SLF9_9AQUA
MGKLGRALRKRVWAGRQWREASAEERENKNIGVFKNEWHEIEVVDITKVEEQARQLEKDLVEKTKTRIETAEIILVAARKMKEAPKAFEVVALVEINALSNSESSSAVLLQKPDVDEANVSKAKILRRVEETTDKVKISKKTFEEALSRVEAANRGKLAVEKALRKWQSEHGVHNSTKFKNSYPPHLHKDSRVLDANGLNLVNDESKPILRSTLSIGQIMSRKLLLTKEYENGMQTEKSNGKPKVSLGQMLSKPSGDLHAITLKGEKDGGHKQLLTKRKKFGFAQILLLVTKQGKKKKKQTASLRCYSG